jgi:D-alanyl-D-alanine carboxypeptidase
MSGVVALSGYLDSPNYEPLVFSIIVNESDQPAATISKRRMKLCCCLLAYILVKSILQQIYLNG